MTGAAPQTYRPDIDGLRAVSILLVVLYHGFGSAVPGGFAGVDVFFVISGYLITGQIYGKCRSGDFSFVDFYARRIRRIFPPLLVVLFFVAVCGYLLLNLNDFTSLYRHIAAASVFASNFLLWNEVGYFDQQAELKPLLHLWSLGIEEQFYVLWPLLVVGLDAAARHLRGAVGLALLLVCAASLLAGIRLAAHDPIGAFYSPLSRCWELGLGGILAVWELDRVATREPVRFRLAKDAVSVAGVVCLAGCALLLGDQSRFPGVATALPALSSLAIIAAGPGARINRHLLGSRPMVWLGLVSYGLYLWHWPLLSLARIEYAGHLPAIHTWVALTASVVLATLTRRLVEIPIRNCRARSVPVWLSVALVAIGITGVLGYKSGILWPQRLAQQAGIQSQIKEAWREFDADGIPKSDCTGIVAPESVAYRNCQIWGSPAADHTVAVWGDSMSVAWMPPFFALVRDRGWRVIQFSHTGCPPIVGVWRTDRTDLDCTDATLPGQILEGIRRARPEVVFLIGRWNLYYHGHIKNDVLVDESFVTDAPGKATAATASAAFERRLPETIEQLSALGRLVVFKDTPVLKVPVDVGMSRRPDDFEPRTDEVARFESGIDRVIDTAVARAPGAVVLDPTERLCTAGTCPAFLDGLPAYFDEAHPTAHATMQFLGEIESLGAKR